MPTGSPNVTGEGMLPYHSRLVGRPLGLCGA